MRRRRALLTAALATAVALTATASALAITHKAAPGPTTASTTGDRQTPTTLTQTGTTKSPPNTLPTAAATTTGLATTTTTVGGRADSLLYVNGVNQTASDVSYVIIASCTSGRRSTIQVTV